MVAPSAKTKNTPYHLFLLLVLFILTLSFMTSCATKSKTAAVVHPSSRTTKTEDLSRREQHLRGAYRQWTGTTYAMGGNDMKGVDCSGFVRAIYKRIFDIHVPRTTEEQLKQGTPVKRVGLEAGDLVFFRPPGYPRHVGIYLSNNEFMHASKTQGVTISRIDSLYWGKYYWTARRLYTNP
jgi:cell wall-associated NlpC family hydrolase